LGEWEGDELYPEAGDSGVSMGERSRASFIAFAIQSSSVSAINPAPITG